MLFRLPFLQILWYNQFVKERNDMYNLLICDDEKDIVNALKIYLSDPSYELYTASNGEEALRIVEREDIHLVLMDIMMPVKDGMTALSEIRKISNVPVIFLTAKSEDTDKILGLNIGADDYITKPFSFKEMVMRVGAQLRRYYEFNAVPSGDRHYGKLMISSTRFEAKADGEPLNLTAKEFKILDYLTIHENQIMPKQKLIDDVWGVDEYIDENTVAVTIARLRDKLSKAGINNVVTVWGLGYKWQD